MNDQAEARRRKPMTMKNEQVQEQPAIPTLPPATGSASRDEEIETLISGMTVARKAILEDLSRRHKEGDKTVKMNGNSQSEYDDDGPRNYISGAGEIDCPVCKAAKLRYSRASYNGHVHAACMSAKCVRWME